MKYLDGYKTYIVATLLLVASVIWNLGYIDTQAYLLVLSVLVPAQVGALRSAINKIK